MFSIFESLWSKLLAVLAVVLIGWYLVHTYNNYVSEKAVAANDLLWVGKFNKQTKDYNALGQQFIDLGDQVRRDRIQAAADAKVKLLQEQHRADTATRLYQTELRIKKQWATERDTLVAGNTELLGRLRDAERPLAARDGDSAEVGRLREFGDRLGRIYDQCEQGLARVRSIAAAAVDRASAAEAAARALKVPQ